MRKAKDGSQYPQMPLFEPPAAERAQWEERLRADAVPVLVDPGDLVMFSGAHLHSSVPNHTALHRCSTEWRFVDQRDLRAGRGALLVDSNAPRLNLQWFKGALDGKMLTAEGDDGYA